jgi:uncharacterized protein
MKYRRLGRTGVDISEIGLGTEMLSQQDGATIAATFRRAAEAGVTFFDLPGWWPELRDAEGAALAGIRSRVMLSMHLGVVYCKPEQPTSGLSSYVWASYEKTRKPVPCEASVEDYLRRLRTDRIDVLFLSWIDEDADFEKAFDTEGFLGLALRLKQEGKARFLGVSTHRTPIGMKAIGTGLVDVVLFPVNAAHDLFPGDRGLDLMWRKDPYGQVSRQWLEPSHDRLDFYRACEERNVGLIAMKPYAGGLLLRKGDVLDFLRGKGFEHPGGLALTPVQCLSYVLSRPGLCAALPGPANPAELEATLAYENASDGEKDFSGIDANALWKLERRCVYCNHCLPCPESIAVGGLLKLLDSEEHHPDARARAAYGALAHRASDCTECGVCVERCPFGVDVPARMRRAVELFRA